MNEATLRTVDCGSNGGHDAVPIMTRAVWNEEKAEGMFSVLRVLHHVNQEVVVSPARTWRARADQSRAETETLRSDRQDMERRNVPYPARLILGGAWHFFQRNPRSLLP